MCDTSSMRIAKRIARAGLCSRRDAEKWIGAGRIMLNGRKIHDPACNVINTDIILVDGKPLPSSVTPKLWRYH
ncbi:MAG: S4 domain-containing protein, partial [Pseudomonadota bacterium]